MIPGTKNNMERNNINPQDLTMASDANQECFPSNDDLPTVLLHRLPSFNSPLKEILQPHFHLLDPADSPEPASSFLSSHAKSVRALICLYNTPLGAETLRLLPSLEFIVATSAGVDHIDLEECRGRGIIMTNASKAFAEDAADYAVALLIDVCRRISTADRYVRAGLWQVNRDYPLGFKLGRKRVGIVGLGRIGFEVGKRLEAFGCSIAYNSRQKKPSVPFSYHANVVDLAEDNDALILCCPLTEQTHHIINREVLEALGKEGVIINVGRGALIDEKLLVKFLSRGDIAGAGLDVFENEPDVPREVFELDNVVLSPHRAIFTPESLEALNELVFTNLKAFFSNKPLQSVFKIEGKDYPVM
ncbi:2-HYDROXYACID DEHYDROGENASE-RELATED [Salix koriyanagi]|uniref:glyoxylate reductase (NADP(+)) n=1 Tax=Salix koriyanagi TaxID=2511006 RepID=A0A9Q0T068_9ROSI|nr:2-HYDROXYACID DEHYDROGENASE-RELATED [Salix koriyanagi]